MKLLWLNSLELLIIHYKSFLKFIKEMVKSGKDRKIIIDPAKHYKNKEQIFMDMNSSKLKSPIILIDPTFKERNALAGLSEKTFEEFKKTAKKFLKNPSIEFFKEKVVDLNKVKQNAKKRGYEFILIEVKTIKQEGDVAGSKLFKFYNFLAKEIEKFFDIKGKDFSYEDKKSARYYFVVKSKKEIIIPGPMKKDKKNMALFKKAHKKILIKGNRMYGKEKLNFSLKKFIENWKKNESRKKQMKQMYISDLRVI